MKPPEKYLEEAIEGIAIESVLDVGTGHSGVFNYHWWESKGLIKKACVDIFYIREDIPGWEKHIADARDLPFEDNSFHLVQCTEMIEHVPVEDHLRVIKELKRVASKVVYITSSGLMSHLGEAQRKIEKENPFQKYIQIVDKDLLLSEGFRILYYHKEGINEKVKAVFYEM